MLEVAEQLGAALEPGAAAGHHAGAGDTVGAQRVLIVLGVQHGAERARHRGRRVAGALEQRDRALVGDRLGVAP